jgi:hypothetical protein
MIKSLAIALSLLAAPAAAQQSGTPGAGAGQQPAAAAAQHWNLTRDAAVFTPLGLSFPTRVRSLEADVPMEFSAQGQSLDNGIQYRSRESNVHATVYVYRPGLPHAGVAHYTTNSGILSSDAAVRALGTRIVDAGGARGVAIRSDYSGYHGNGRSIAAFMKVGTWIVKLRVSGPEGAAAEVEAAMSALLSGIKWGSERPRPAALLDVARCGGGEGRAEARALDLSDEQVINAGLLATMDGAGVEATENGARQILPPRLPAALCLSSAVPLNDRTVDVLRAPADSQSDGMGRTRLLVPLSDNGGVLEVVEMTNMRRHVVLYHSLGETAVLGAFDGPPSDAQLGEIFAGRDREATRVRAVVGFSVTGDASIEVQRPSQAPSPGPQVPTT